MLCFLRIVRDTLTQAREEYSISSQFVPGERHWDVSMRVTNHWHLACSHINNLAKSVSIKVWSIVIHKY